MDPLVVLGGVNGARRYETANPGRAWSIRLACREVIMGDMQEAAARQRDAAHRGAR